MSAASLPTVRFLIPAELQVAILSDYAAGESALHVAKRRGVSQNTVLRLLRARGVPVRHPFASRENQRRAAQPIPQFPPDIDRASFGHWLSGFVDGEGHFALCVRWASRNILSGPKLYWTVNIGFSIELRADDAAALSQIQSYFGCGRVVIKPAQTTYVRGNPSARYGVYRASDLHGVLLPHFASHPLRSKKARDLAVWKEAVELCHASRARGTLSRKTASIRWTEAEIGRLVELAEMLSAQRAYQSDNVPTT